jgi:hypothetical protein
MKSSSEGVVRYEAETAAINRVFFNWTDYKEGEARPRHGEVLAAQLKYQA